MKFRKKPVVIEAVQIEKGMSIPDWLLEAAIEKEVDLYGLSTVTRDQPYALIHTLEGTMRGDAGDWIIRGVVGELYPCKDDIFRATYEPVEEA